MDLKFLFKKKGVGYLSQNENPFSSVYFEVRKKEHRILTDKEVKRLPFMILSNPNAREWKLRQKSTERFIKYLKTKPKKLQIIDIGCGNGWFTNLISEVSQNNNVIGLDVNSLELEQAARVFKNENLQFVYGDVFQINLMFNDQFDIIILNASIQYFTDFNKIVERLKLFLKSEGEIHIIDSPFYKKEELPKAKNRTGNYYKQLGFPDMASYYFHHNIVDVSDFEILYKPKKHIWNTPFKGKDSPFYWLKKSFI